MTTATVNRDTLQKLLDYVSEEEARDFEECQSMGWTTEELEHHAHKLIQELQDCINDQ
jgi:hypothetical protein